MYMYSVMEPFVMNGHTSYDNTSWCLESIDGCKSAFPITNIFFSCLKQNCEYVDVHR